MKLLSKLRLLALSLGISAALMSLPSNAEDIDIFTGASGGTAAAPKVMILMDNSLNWVEDQPAGKSKFDALAAVVNSITTPMNVGLAMFTGPSNSTQGAYIRFAPRDMSVAANRTAFINLLNVISYDIPPAKHASLETNGRKEESAALYEIYKYYSALSPRSGTSNTTINPYVDVAGNAGGSYPLDTPNPPASNPGPTAASQGLTSGFAFKTISIANDTYDSVATTCGKAYIIYIVANNAGPGSVGSQTYEGISAGPQILPSVGTETWAEEWSRYLYTHQSVQPSAPQVSTYVLDAYYPDNNQDAPYSDALSSIAKQGGGSYKHVRNQTDITNELNRIFAEIKGVNSTFASASLPVNATSRAQNLNQVYIGIFRPDVAAQPRWFGNMKRFQLVATTAGTKTTIDLGDANGIPAVSPVTGFLKDCSTSFWTADSGTYWQGVAVNPVVQGSCPSTSTTFSPYSDSPDGPFVEKGSVAEVIRMGNNPPAPPTPPATTYTYPTPTRAVNRTFYTLNAGGTALTAVTAAVAGLTQTLTDFVMGKDVATPAERTANETRPSLHGDVVHSRPLPLDYGTAGPGIVTYYGSNDGTFRAVDAATGKEKWAFIAPEFFTRFQRLMDNSPLIKFSNTPTPTTATPKDYFFDGNTGVYQDATNANVWVYPSMRRGGRMLYSLNVTDPARPSFKWRAGCPTTDTTADASCTSASMAKLGLTWSSPSVAFIKSYNTGGATPTYKPVVIVGGGYDTCEDADNVSPSCTSTKGNIVYILDAADGTVVKSFNTTRSVPADIALIDVDKDGLVDYAYAADTGGTIYRIDFNGSDSSTWVMNPIAHTSGSGRKFLFPPALFQAATRLVYLAIGSGDREHPLATNYPYKRTDGTGVVTNAGVVNRLYVFKDNLGVTTPNKDLDDTAIMADYTTDPACDSTKLILPGSALNGWFVNLNQYGPGEQTVTSAVIVGGSVNFSTNRPIPAASGTCGTTLGEARGYFLSLLNGSGGIGVAGVCGGSRSSTFIGGGLPPSPVLARVPINGVLKTVLIGAVQKDASASSPIASQLVTPSINAQRRRVYKYKSID